MNAVTTSDVPLYRWRFANCEFDEARQELRVDGAVVAMEPRPLQVLAELLRHAGEVVTKQELFDTVWAGRPTVDHVLATAVGKLRRAFGEPGERLIATIPRIGYRFAGTAERIAVGQRLSSELALATGQAVPGREHFVLETQLGRTRGSEVWLARHAKTREARVYKFGLDAERLSALKREATIARVLRETLGERDDFVRILDWNFADEPFFLESAWGGHDLVAWASQEPDLAAWPVDARIAFFLPIADAVAAAHGVGVLHKDLKPGNVLVQAREDGGWRTRLADFGSGRLLQPERLAELGITALGMTQAIATDDSSGGTLLYLAPEVIAGRTPTAQSDVYALGILLYQIVISDLRKPLTSGWEHDIADPLLREDIARATDGDPSRRLASAAELADRLRRLSERRAERERQAQLERSAQASRQALERAYARRPWVAASVALLVLGLGLTAWLYHRADAARIGAEREAARSEAIQHFLSDDLLGAADPSNAEYNGDPTIAELLRRAESTLQGRFGHDPRIRGGIYDALARSYAGFGRYEDAIAGYRHAAEAYAAALGPSDSSTLRARYDEARVQASAHHYEEAQRLLDATDKLAGARATSETVLALHAALARGMLHNQRFEIEPMLRDYAAADALQRQAYPDDASLAYAIRSQLVDGHLRHGDVDAAETVARQMLADPLLAEQRIGKAARAYAHVQLARVLRRRDRFDEALAEAEAAAPVLKSVLGARHPRTLDNLSVLSSLYSDLDRCEPAIATAKEAVDGYRAIGPPSDQQVLIAIGNLGLKEHYCNDPVHALEHLTTAERGLSEHYGRDNAAAQSFRFSIAGALSDTGRYDEALALLETLSADALKASFARPDTVNQIDDLRGRIYVLHGRREEGLKILRALRDRIAKAGDDEDAVQILGAFIAEHEAH